MDHRRDADNYLIGGISPRPDPVQQYRDSLRELYPGFYAILQQDSRFDQYDRWEAQLWGIKL
jgi:hypothetical protein